MDELNEIKEEVVSMIDENTKVVVLGFPDPFNPNVIDFQQRCLLKDSLHVMNKRLDEIDFDKEPYRYYDFSALYIADERGYWFLPQSFNLSEDNKFIYGYTVDRKINVQEEFKGIIAFTDDLMVKVIRND